MWINFDIPKEEQLDKDDDDDNDEVQKLSTRQIKGYQIDIMLNHIGDMFLGVNSPHEDYKNLLQVWKYYLCLLQATNDEIGCSGSEKKKNHVADLNVYGLLLRKALQAVSTKDVVKAKYIHYTLHIPAMVEEFGSLCVYSNQGFENSHKYHKTLCNRITNNGGSKHPIPLIVAIMNWQCRKMLSCIETDSDWGKIVLRNRLTSKKPLDTLLNRTYFDTYLSTMTGLFGTDGFNNFIERMELKKREANNEIVENSPKRKKQKRKKKQHCKNRHKELKFLFMLVAIVNTQVISSG